MANKQVDVNLKLDINLNGIIDDIDDMFKKQIPYAGYLALNDTVYKGSMHVKRGINYYIEGGAVPFTKRGVQYQKAPNKRELVAHIFIPDNQWKYMRWMVQGGTKRWDKSKHGIGKPIYANTRFNKYGNIPGRRRKEGLWREILNRGKGTTAIPMKGNLQKGQFIKDFGKGPALWKRSRDGIKLLMVFDRKAEYGRARFPFNKNAILFAKRNFPKYFNKRVRELVNKQSKRLRAK